MKGIWTESETCGFAEFKQSFNYAGGGAVVRISAAFRYAAFINGVFVSNGQYADIPEKKRVDEIDVSSFVRKGENELYIVAMHTLEDFSIARAMDAYLVFEVLSRGVVLAESSENTLGRVAANYLLGDRITPQLGWGWKYDFTIRGGEWKKCRPAVGGFTLAERPVRKLSLSEPLPSEIVAQGIFRYRGGETAAERAQNAWLSTLRFADMTGRYRVGNAVLDKPLGFSADLSGGDGLFVVADLSGETSGYLSFSLTVEKPCSAILCWGEHLSDLRIRSSVEGRNFASELALKAGENSLDEYLCRVGCRYLGLYVEGGAFTLNRLTVREAVYPFKKEKKKFGDRLLDKIYEMGRRTLELCAHEHYEDCPWREQALYGMDSRNQMLFGYGAFEEYEYPRASLRLFADTQRDDGLIVLCAPARGRMTIPSFTAYWILAVCENAEADYDGTFVEEILPKAEKALKAFEKRSDEKGVSLFAEPEYWNFHEWSEGLDGGDFNRTEKISAASDCILTSVVAIAAKKFAALEEKFGNAEKAKEAEFYAKSLEESLENFFDAEKGLYASYIDEGERRGYHAYTQAAALLACENMSKERQKTLSEILKNPEGKVVPMTFAAFQLKYDGIVKAEGDVDWCIEDVCETFGKMLFAGATSYWETALGEADFADAGSLCHGWSAVACYVLDKYMGQKR